MSVKKSDNALTSNQLGHARAANGTFERADLVLPACLRARFRWYSRKFSQRRLAGLPGRIAKFLPL
jgi:hypothetical protein